MKQGGRPVLEIKGQVNLEEPLGCLPEDWSGWSTTSIWASSELWRSLECSSSWSCGIDEEDVSEGVRHRSGCIDPMEWPEPPLLLPDDLWNLETSSLLLNLEVHIWHPSPVILVLTHFCCKDHFTRSMCCWLRKSAHQFTPEMWMADRAVTESCHARVFSSSLALGRLLVPPKWMMKTTAVELLVWINFSILHSTNTPAPTWCLGMLCGKGLDGIEQRELPTDTEFSYRIVDLGSFWTAKYKPGSWEFAVFLRSFLQKKNSA